MSQRANQRKSMRRRRSISWFSAKLLIDFSEGEGSLSPQTLCLPAYSLGLTSGRGWWTQRRGWWISRLVHTVQARSFYIGSLSTSSQIPSPPFPSLDLESLGYHYLCWMDYELPNPHRVQWRSCRPLLLFVFYLTPNLYKGPSPQIPSYRMFYSLESVLLVNPLEKMAIVHLKVC